MATYNVREFHKILHNNGFELHHIKGSHAIYRKGKRQLVIPTTRCNKMIVRRLIKEYELEI